MFEKPEKSQADPQGNKDNQDDKDKGHEKPGHDKASDKGDKPDHDHPRIELNGAAPDFKANSTHGEVQMSTFGAGKWVLLMSHPADFTPVCTTEFVELARRSDELDKQHILPLALSVDSVYSHIAWIRQIEQQHHVQIKFPIIADVDQKISQLYGMIHSPSALTATVRCCYFIDPNRVIRAMIYYPLNIGRSVDEIIRVFSALQFADKHKLSCPANWKAGEPGMMPAPQTQEIAEERMNDKSDKSVQVTDWYLARKSVQ